jgi:hypothetical protein
MSLEVSHVIGIVGFFFTVLLAVAGYVAKHQRELGGILERLSVVETRMGLFWKSVEQHVAQMFKLPTHHRLDELLDKFTHGTLTWDESWELDQLFRERLTHPDITPERRIWGDLVLKGIHSYQIELERRMRPRPPSWWTRLAHWWAGRGTPC